MQILQNNKQIDVVIMASTPDKETQLNSLMQVGGYSFVNASDLNDLVKLKAQDFEFGIAIIDHKIAFDSKTDFVRKVKDLFPAMQSIIVSSESRIDLAMRASNEGVFWLLQEPYENEELLYLIARGTVVYQLSKENQVLREAMKSSLMTDRLIADSEVMRRLLARIQKIAALDSSVLLTGESGTGKTLLASTLHKCSARSNGPFTAISCANLPKDLLESELFGSEKGAFTGANVSRPGAIELCAGGTLFLDEIGELPLETQPKLLTFLQDKMVRRLGGRNAKKVDVRIVCATNRDLAKAVEQGIFREDLFYRVNVLHVHVPALRERKSDIKSLCQQFLLKIAKQRGRSEPWKLSSAALNFLINYSWPGNIRELEHALERASAFSENSELQVSDFEIGLYVKSATDRLTLAGSTLKEIETKLIRETLSYCSNSKIEAAKMLGISLKTMYNKIKSLDKNDL